MINLSKVFYAGPCGLYGTHKLIPQGKVDITYGNTVYSGIRFENWYLWKCRCGDYFATQSDVFEYGVGAPIGYYLDGLNFLAGNAILNFAQSNDPVFYCNKPYLQGFSFLLAG